MTCCLTNVFKITGGDVLASIFFFVTFMVEKLGSDFFILKTLFFIFLSKNIQIKYFRNLNKPILNSRKAKMTLKN
jgi:hypothetical protein